MNPELIHLLNARIEQCVAQLDAGETEAALAELRSVVTEGTAGAAWGVVASAHGLLAQVLIQAGEREEATPHVQAGLTIARQLEQDDAVQFFEQLAEVLSSGAALPDPALEQKLQAALQLLEGGQVEEGFALLREVVDEADPEREPGLLATAHNFLAQALGGVGRRDEALEHARAGLAIAHQVNQAEAIEAFEQLVSSLQGDAPELGQLVNAQLQAAMGALESGDLDAGEEILSQIVALGAPPAIVGLAVSARGLMAQVQARKGDRAAAQRYAQEAWDMLPDDAPEQIRDHFMGLLTALGVAIA